MALNNFVKCKLCGKSFLKTGSRTTCTACTPKEEELFSSMKEYIFQYPKASMAEIAAQLDIPEQLIDDWITQKRVELKASSVKTYPCEMCGNPIHVGKICRKCQQKLGEVTKELNESIKGETGSDGKSKMYIADKITKWEH